MISRIIGRTDKVPSRWIVLLFLATISISKQVSCSGVFQLNLVSFKNDNGFDNLSKCCSDGRTVSDAERCTQPCRTFFWICFRHFQYNIPKNDLQCTYGQTTTSILGFNSFNSSNNNTKYLISLPFEFTWPGSFTLIIEAWHDTTGTGPYEGSNRTLISRVVIQRKLDVGLEWRPDLYVSRYFRLDYLYRVICNENFYGEGCSEKCTPRDDIFGHYTCSQNGTRICRSGWTGDYCQTPICLDGCNVTNGYCEEPFECKCRLGWQGPLCDKCIPYPGCLHGGCNDRWQCNCHEGWGGLFCNQDLNFCTNNLPCVNGATCKNTGEGSYTCDCPVGFTGTNCEIEVFDCYRNQCLNNGICKQLSNKQHKCECPNGVSGRRCEISAKSCQDSPCKNHGTCRSTSDGYRCECPHGFTGSNCDVDIDECDSVPCLNGGRCIDEHGRYRCVCPAGFTGDRCENDRNDCLPSPCLNGGVCLDRVNHFHCRCPAGFTGELCQDNVDDCMTLPCANGGTCHDRDNGFRCSCAPGFTGRDCSNKINECLSEPCVRGTCQDIMNGFRCICDSGFTGVHCEVQLHPFFHTSLPTYIDTSSGRTSDGNSNITLLSTTVQSDPVSEVPYGTIVLIVCMGILLTLLVLSVAVVIVVLRRRNRIQRASRGNCLSEKMNNADIRQDEYASGQMKDDGVSKMKLQQPQHKQQRFMDFTTREQVQMQRNINHTNNLKNVDKCPPSSGKHNNALKWETTANDTSLGKTTKTMGDVEKYVNKPNTRSHGSYNQSSDDLLWKSVPQNVCFVRHDSTGYSEGAIATEV